MTTPAIELAENTTEATSIAARGDFAYKHLRDPQGYRGMSAEERNRQLRLRCAESQLWPEFNPMLFDERQNRIISPLVDGEKPLRRQVRQLIEHFRRTNRGYFADIGKHNVILRKQDNRMIVIDFEIDENHPHWKPRKPLYDHIDHFE